MKDRIDRAQQIAFIAGRLQLLALSFTLSLTTAGIAAGQSFTAIDYPGATATYANGMNDGGDIVGHYTAGGVAHGFLLSAGTFTQIDFAGAKNTRARGINSQGDVVGSYDDTGGRTHAFLLSKGKFTSLDNPDGVTDAYAINSAGDVAGMLTPAGKPMQGFLLKAGAWSVNDYHAPSTVMNCILGMNDAGVTVGHLSTRASQHGFVSRKGTVTQIDYGGGGNTEAYGINAAGDVVGDFQDVAQGWHGFLLKDGRFTQIDYPGSPHTMVYGINASGQIVGHFQDTKKIYHGFVAQVTPAGPAPPVLTVDDDGLDCPGALRTIQEAVAKAPAGATILVCAGTYRGSVNIVGPEKNALKMIAMGRADEVVLQGDYSERYGFYLENVSNVLIRGFTIRDFADIAHSTKASEWGSGSQIQLVNAHYNTIEQNRVINGEMIGIGLSNSGNNIVQYNLAWVNNSALGNCGIHVGAAGSANNVLRLNVTYGNNMAGIMLANAGPGNIVSDNVVVSNGRDGITNTGTKGTWIEGNRVSYNRGPWGTNPYAADVKNVGRGITIGTSDGVTVFDNRARGNSGTDINWDGSGQVKFDANACDASTPSGSCGNSPSKPAVLNLSPGLKPATSALGKVGGDPVLP